MKKTLVVLSVVMGFTILCACDNHKTNSTTSDVSSSQTELKQKEKAPHEEQRLLFNNIQLGNKDNDFQGGTSLEELEKQFGKASSNEQVPAGNVTLDVYYWNFDNVKMTIQLYQNSTIAKSFSNFSFNRDQSITQKDFAKINIGITYTQVRDILAEPDVLSQSVSSDGEQIQAIWVSNLKSNQKASITIKFNNNSLVSKEESQLSKT